MNTVVVAGHEQSPSTPMPTDFRMYLQAELVRRCKSNPMYSLRAFARYLEVEPSFLSKILNRKRSVTTATLDRFGKKLGLSPTQMDDFRKNLPAKDSAASTATAVTVKLQQSAMDQFQLVSDWYHYAILELMQVEGFQPDSRWIARALGISPSEANDAVERLIRLGMIEVQKDGSFKAAPGDGQSSGDEFAAAAFRNLQRHVLSLALQALEETPLELRDQSSMTVAIDPTLIPEAKERIRQFRRELAAFLTSGPGKKTAVYHLGLSLYPVTKLRGAAAAARAEAEALAAE